MRHLLAILAALILCTAPVQSQTLKSLMYNTTNGQVVANTGTNNLTFNDSAKFNGGITVSDVFASGFETLPNTEIQITDEGIDFNTTSSAATTRANLGATTIGSAVFTAANAVAARQALGLQSYTITLTNSLNVLEIGSSYTTVNYGWSIQPTNAVFAVRQLESTGAGTNPLPFSLSLTNNTGSSSTTFGAPITNDRTWTLRVEDGLGITNTVVSTILFQNYMIWGRSANTTLSNAEIQTLHTNGGGSSRAFATSRSRSFTMDGGGQYLYVAYPLSFGSATAGGVTHAMIVDGNVFNNFVVTTNTYVNPQGFTNTYLVYRTANIINGSGVAFTVQ
jgi:hypothetical protein